jgi:DNA-directed RNA polymerase
MATATAERPIFEEPLPPGPPNGFPHSATTTRPSTGHHDFPNPASPIVIRDFLGTKLKYLGSSLRDTNDALALLNACLHLERFERAASVLRRFSQGVQHRGPELLDAHVRYLGKLVDYAVRKRSETHLRSAQQWFEVEIKGRGVEPNATIYALMLKASLNFLQGPKLARTVRRYMDMAICAGRDLEVLHSPVLSEADLFLVTKVRYVSWVSYSPLSLSAMKAC